jgi:hypothetical protein
MAMHFLHSTEILEAESIVHLNAIDHLKKLIKNPF